MKASAFETNRSVSFHFFKWLAAGIGPEAACQDTTTFRAPRPIVRFLTVATFTAAIATYKPSDIIALSRAAITDRGC
jgi:hypothetical protein